MKEICILGSTGSIGRQTLSVIKQHPERFRALTLAADSNWQVMLSQAREFSPAYVAMSDPVAAEKIAPYLPKSTKLIKGEDALAKAAETGDLVVAAVSGFAGIKGVLRAVECKKDVALANKETLVAAGSVIMPKARKFKSEIIPVDSEHSAIWQCIGQNREYLKKIILTASGGALRDLPLKKMKNVTPELALAHPNWKMGRKITVDCATMMNKGLEVIEAQWLFGLPAENIEILIHPQSAVHSAVEFFDNTVIANMSYPSMEIPIQLALAYPDRLPLKVPELDLTSQPLTFTKPDFARYPALKLALGVAKEGGILPAVMNAANEIAVEAFLKGEIAYLSIEKAVGDVLSETVNYHPIRIEEIFESDKAAREKTLKVIENYKINKK